MTSATIRDLLASAGRHEAFQELARSLVRGERGPFTLEGLTPAGIEAGDDYITIMLRNLDTLVAGLTVNS